MYFNIEDTIKSKMESGGDWSEREYAYYLYQNLISENGIIINRKEKDGSYREVRNSDELLAAISSITAKGNESNNKTSNKVVEVIFDTFLSKSNPAINLGMKKIIDENKAPETPLEWVILFSKISIQKQYGTKLQTDYNNLLKLQNKATSDKETVPARRQVVTDFKNVYSEFQWNGE